jgi:hypothetical protein
VAPGVTSATFQNPGYTYFNIDLDTLLAQDLVMEFLLLEKTYGWEHIPEDYKDWPFRTVNFKEEFGLADLSVASIETLRMKLENDSDFLFTYLTRKIGYDPMVPEEFAKAMDLHINDLGLITPDEKPYMYFCQMYSAISKVDIDNCVAKYTQNSGFLK